jgi:putative SOS response-associated peptidase YedK
MCGRFTLKARPEVLAEHFVLTEVPGVMPRYNIAPTQAVAVVRAGSEGSRRELSPLRWGLIPSWADDPLIGNRMINARAETAAQKPAYRSAFRLRRCLVLADGFFEWANTNGAKQPHYFQLKDGGPFAFAGLWERWAKGEEPIESCTLLTTEANEVVSPVHQRMPVLLEPEDYGRWLDPQRRRPEEVSAILRPFPAERMIGYPVGRFVNDPRNEDPRCVERVA